MSKIDQRLRPSRLRPLAGSLRWGTALAAAAAAALAICAPAHAVFGIDTFEAGTFAEDGAPDTQAGSHPHTARTDFIMNLLPSGDADDRLMDVNIKLPAGFAGNPLATSRCSRAQFAMVTGDNGTAGIPSYKYCPASSQVGVVDVKIANGPTLAISQAALWNLVPPPGKVAQFGFVVLTAPITIDVSLDPLGNYRLVASSRRTSTGLQAVGTDVRVWGVPNHPRHDVDRYCGRANGGQAWFDPPCPVDAPLTPFLTNPTHCRGPEVSFIEARSWQEPDVWASASAEAPALTGCEKLTFLPSMTATPSSRAAGMPTGLSVDLDLPAEDDSATGLAPAQLKDVSVELPEGMTVNPSSANGLEACTDAQVGFGNDAPAACPAGSKVGSVRAQSPVLEETLSGGVFVRTQASDDPASGDMVRLALVLESEERGIRVKLPGRVHLDPNTGRVTTRFVDNPELPVSRIEFQVKEGPRAPLVAPSRCGRNEIAAELTSWAGQSAAPTPGFDVECGPGLGAFAPSFSAGTVSPVAGSHSPFTLAVDKPDGQSDIDGVSLAMPKGLLASLKGNIGQRVGTARVAAGPGSSPYWLSGPVVLEGAYGDAPFSLRVTVPAKAGPFDLGDVVVRQRIYVDPETAEVRVVSDPLPTIVKGIPVRLQNLRVDIDRPGFTLNPTSCAEQRVAATLGASTGQQAEVGSPFQVGECRSLGFAPRLGMRLSGKKQTRTGGHPALTANVSSGKGQANISGAKVTLPRSVVLDPLNTVDPKMLCDYDASLKADCPQSSVIGKATAVTPVLNKPLAGDVHLVQGIKFGKAGNRIRTTPSLLVKLRGEVAINLRARTTTEPGTNRLVTTFGSVPDAPVSKFTMKIAGGKKGILVVTRTARRKLDLCSFSQIADAELAGHNGKQADFATRVKTPCGAKVAKKAKRAKRAGGGR